MNLSSWKSNAVRRIVVAVLILSRYVSICSSGSEDEGRTVQGKMNDDDANYHRHHDCPDPHHLVDEQQPHVILVKIGGSSITVKSQKETLDTQSISWFVSTLQSALLPDFLSLSPTSPLPNKTVHHSKECKSSSSSSHTNTNSNDCDNVGHMGRILRSAFVVVHGAGSFGHHTAKEYGLKGFSQKNISTTLSSGNHTTQQKQHCYDEEDPVFKCEKRRYQMEGLAKTRLSVQTLNRHMVEAFLAVGINAVGISPCFAIHPGYWPTISRGRLDHNAKNNNNNKNRNTCDDDVGGCTNSQVFQTHLATVIQTTLQAGLVPIIHGDACVTTTTTTTSQPVPSHRQPRPKMVAGILSGDTLMSILGQEDWIDEAIYLTDVDGVFTSDPKLDDHAQLIPKIVVHRNNRSIQSFLELSTTTNTTTTTLHAGASIHQHDVTGGLETKLESAFDIATSCDLTDHKKKKKKHVIIVKCGSKSAQHVLQRNYNHTQSDRFTTIVAVGDDEESESSL